jgi:serine/threonine-protein kinase
VAREPKVAVPDVAGQNAFAAATTLQQAGFTVTVVSTPNDTVPKDTVIGTDPPAGTQLAKGTEVKLQVSTGPAPVTVPSVVGMQRAAAEQLLLSTLGFNVKVSLVNAGPTKKGIVISQNPAAGTDVPKASEVTIVVGN